MAVPPSQVPYPAPQPGPHRGSAPPGGLGGGGRRVRGALSLILAVILVMLVGVIYALTHRELTRAPTAAELRAAGEVEQAVRWRSWPVDRLFPGRLPYQPSRGSGEQASRAGVAPGTSCAEGVDPELAGPLDRHGCRAVLRASYTDQLQGVVVTIGIVALPDAAAADRALRELPAPPPEPSTGPGAPDPPGPSVRAAAFPGTAAARFTDEARQHRTVDRAGAYLVLTASGQTDGRAASTVTRERPGDLFAVSGQLGRRVAGTLGRVAAPQCEREAEWAC